MVVDGLRLQLAQLGALLDEECCRATDDQDHRGGRGHRHRCGPRRPLDTPWRWSCRSGGRPARRKTPLERQRRSVLRQVHVENFAKNALSLSVVAARSACGEVLSKLARQLRRKAPSQPIQVLLSSLAAVHIPPRAPFRLRAIRGEPVAQYRSRAREPRLHGSRRAAQYVRHLRFRHPFDVQENDSPKRLRERMNRG